MRTVATTPQDVTAGDTADFGANDWLIEELREQFQADPGSVDDTWAAYFRAENGQSPATAAAPPGPATPVTTPAAPTTRPAAPAATAPADAAPRAPKAATPPQPAEQTAPEAEPEAEASTPPRGKVERRTTRVGGPEAPGSGQGISPDLPRITEAPSTERKDVVTPLRGPSMRTAANMEGSLAVPTATSVRDVPMKLAIDQRQMINEHLARSTGGKVSFTHLIGYAMVRALAALPEMNNHYELIDGKPNLVAPAAINLGLAIDLAKPDGTRQLLVPNIKNCADLDFVQFWGAYDKLVDRARKGKLTVDDFAGTTATLTNPGGLGTNHSVPRLMSGQSVILGVGSIDFPPEFQGTSLDRINALGVSKVTTLTSTYDHRVIQGAQSGQFLKRMHELLIGKHHFYDEIFASLRVPYTPIRWATDVSDEALGSMPRSARVFALINAYRTRGHYMADIDPLEYRQRTHPELAIEHHGLTLWDLDRRFPVGDLGGETGRDFTMREILAVLRGSYCRTVGVEYMHIADNEQREWIQERFERPFVRWSREEHLRILDKLNEAEIFETFLQTKFVGQKRFSLEGGESAIVFLDEVCEQAANAGLDEAVIGMPHRGRLNVLANIVGKSYAQIFREFDGGFDPRLSQGTGDVKYHLGAEGQFTAGSGTTIKTSVAANPSHLEAVNPVLEGIVRAKLDQHARRDGVFPVLPILLHGDASFAGQGVVYETMQMSQLRAYKTGGTIHLVVNNQVGFTTAPVESRSTVYATDIAKGFQSPIFHVNGDDPESVARVAQIAFDYRQRFGRDVVIDLVCYRRRGHNEGDDPSFTQPLMYDLIEQKRSVRRRYTEALIGRGDISTEDAEDVMARFRTRLEGVFTDFRTAEAEADQTYRKVPYYPAKLGGAGGTAITNTVMETIADAQVVFPDGFTVHPKVLPQLQRRADAIRNGPIDWATAETLAFGSLLLEGRPVRLVGQDSRRGTFSQRFAAVVDRVTNESYVPLKHLAESQGEFYIFDSLLSEYAAMGFEYGYSVAAPDALVLWEAQYGDFANGAQTIADEFISSGNTKWTQKSGVVLLLPHGYEGQGPDHTSARLERWLNLCSEGALAVCQPSTPASYFHLLRTHAYVNWHRPVVVATPKSMLRSKQAVSMPADFTEGSWQPAMGDPTITDPASVERILLCSGKIRWDLINARAEAGLDGKVAILSLERLYPLPAKELAAELARYPQVTDIRYVQDEPENQGPWWFLQIYLPGAIAQELPGYELKMAGITRPAGSAPSVGDSKVHLQQNAELMQRAMAG